MLWARALLWVGGVSFLAFGAAFLVAPLELFSAIGLALAGPIAATELMAFYGGLELAVGALVAACALSTARVRDGLVLMSTCYGGIGLARAAGMLVTGARSDFLWFALATELVFAVLGAILLATLKRPAPDAR